MGGKTWAGAISSTSRTKNWAVGGCRRHPQAHVGSCDALFPPDEVADNLGHRSRGYLLPDRTEIATGLLNSNIEGFRLLIIPFAINVPPRCSIPLINCVNESILGSLTQLRSGAGGKGKDHCNSRCDSKEDF